jgi:aspartyl-tRNA(Asn)/glutamyl-tRNA(Gln) amidotransferase subunit A
MNAATRKIEYSPDVARWVEPALRLTLDDYLIGQLDRERARHDYLMAFTEVDVLIGPTQAFPAPEIGQDRVVLGGADHDLLMAIVAYTAPCNLTGMPGVSVPAGFSREGLPVGVQIVAPHFEEARALRVAKAIEDGVAADVKKRRPNV